jgi:hypothetical protein
VYKSDKGGRLMHMTIHYWQYRLLVVVGLLVLAVPSAEAQMLGDTDIGNALTSSLLQTAQQRRHRRRIPVDPYMALIEQSEPDRYIRGLASHMDPLAGTSQQAMTSMASASMGGISVLSLPHIGFARALIRSNDKAPTLRNVLAISGVPVSSSSPGGSQATAMPHLGENGCTVSRPGLAMTSPELAFCH